MKKDQFIQGRYADRLVAHRGYPHRFPENSLAGIEAAIRAGSAYIEVDIQLSADGIPVIFHDRDLQRLCQQPGAIHDFSRTMLAELRIQPTKPVSSEPAFIPTLDQLVNLLKQHPQVKAFIELKRISLEHWGDDRVVETVLACLKPVPGQCVVISYSRTALVKLREKAEQAIGFVSDEYSELMNASVQVLKPEYLFCNFNSLPAHGVLSISGSQLAVYEIADPQLAINLFERGVDLVETFAIVEMRNALLAYGQ